jgi:ParB family chromosome partitioning protein
MTDARPQMVWEDIQKLKPYWNNPRINDEAVEGLKVSIKEYGFNVPIVVDKDFVLITGHTRLKASIELGATEVPVIIATHLTAEQVQAFRIADNKLGEKARWDENRLSEELRQLQDLGFNLTTTGFSAEELDCLTGQIDADCLKDMDYATVCGAVVPKAIQARDNVIVSCGNYKFYVHVNTYKAWEGDLLQQFPKRADLVAELAQRLGFNVYPAEQPTGETLTTEQKQEDTAAQIDSGAPVTAVGDEP